MSTVPPIWRWRLFLIWLGIVVITAIFGCLTPLSETLGFEFSLLISLVSSLGAGHLAACYPSRVRDQKARFPGARLPGLVLYYRALFFGLILLAFPYAISFANSMRVEPCNDLEGTFFYLLLPCCSVVIATATGLFAGLLVPSRIFASILWFLIFFGTVADAFRSFYGTPVVYLFGPFFGYFPGALYDKLVQVEARLVTYRVATMLQAGTLLALSSWLIDPSKLRLSIRRATSKPKTAFLVLALGIASAAMYFAGPTLRHRAERSHLEELLDQHVVRGKLDLYFPAETDPASAAMLADDAEFSLNQVEKYLGVEAEGRIAVFLFKGTGQKARAMGARGTNVAKPWRGEVYVIVKPIPHLVLRHELAHAVSAKLSDGPFKVPGTFGGVVPNPGLIEGLATAAQGPRTDLTVHQWAAAMKKLKLLPKLKKIFGYAFYDLSASRAYIAAGSFSDWVHQNYGAKALTTAYGTGSWKKATGRSLKSLEKSWRKYLTSVSLRAEDVMVAKHRFDRPAVIHSVCVHEVARLESVARRHAKKEKWEQAFDLYEQAYERSGRSTSSKLKRFFAFVDAEKTDEVRDWANGLVEDPEVGSVYRATIREVIADLDLKSIEKRGEVKETYLKLAEIARDDSERRRLQVKAHLTTLEDSSVDNVLRALAARPGSDSTRESTLLAIADMEKKRPDDPVVTYLAARQYFNHGNFPKAVEGLEKADSLGLKDISEAIDLESHMLKGRAFFFTGKYSEAKELFGSVASDESRRLGARALAKDWQERCEFRMN